MAPSFRTLKRQQERERQAARKAAAEGKPPPAQTPAVLRTPPPPPPPPPRQPAPLDPSVRPPPRPPAGQAAPVEHGGAVTAKQLLVRNIPNLRVPAPSETATAERRQSAVAFVGKVRAVAAVALASAGSADGPATPAGKPPGPPPPRAGPQKPAAKVRAIASLAPSKTAMPGSADGPATPAGSKKRTIQCLSAPPLAAPPPPLSPGKVKPAGSVLVVKQPPKRSPRPIKILQMAPPGTVPAPKTPPGLAHAPRTPSPLPWKRRTLMRAGAQAARVLVGEVRLRSRAISSPTELGAKTVDCRSLWDPHAGRLRMHTGRHHGLQRRLQKAPRFGEILREVHAKLTGASVVELMCNHGRHRSVGVAEVVGELLRRSGKIVRLEHSEQPHCRCVPPCGCSVGRGHGDGASVLPATQELWDSFGMSE